MVIVTIRSILLVVLALGLNIQPLKTQQTERVILVDINIKSPSDASKCYTPNFDRKKVELNVEFDDTLIFLNDFVYEEDPLEGPGCFLPEIKIIYLRYTYVISLYCTSVIKYKNSAPYRTSNVRLKNDLAITESVLDYLKKMQRVYFGEHFNAALAQRVVKRDPLPVEDPDEVQLLDDDDDDDISKDALDNDGMFDELDDPEPELQNPDENDKNP